MGFRLSYVQSWRTVEDTVLNLQKKTTFFGGVTKWSCKKSTKIGQTVMNPRKNGHEKSPDLPEPLGSQGVRNLSDYASSLNGDRGTRTRDLKLNLSYLRPFSYSICCPCADSCALPARPCHITKSSSNHGGAFAWLKNVSILRKAHIIVDFSYIMMYNMFVCKYL